MYKVVYGTDPTDFVLMDSVALGGLFATRQAKLIWDQTVMVEITADDAYQAPIGWHPVKLI